MDRDQEVCLCFHVSLRKLQAYLRNERPRLASQLSNCHGAGTGCGWCRPYLERLFRQWQEQGSATASASGPATHPVEGSGDGPGSAAYAERRQAYLRQRAQQSPPPDSDGDSTPGTASGR